MAHGGVSGAELRWGKAADPGTSQELSSPSEPAKRCQSVAGVSGGAFLPKCLLFLGTVVTDPDIATEVMGTKLFSSCEQDYFKQKFSMLLLCIDRHREIS